MIYNNIRGFMDIFKGYIKKLLVEQKDTYDEDNLRLTIDTLSKGMNKKKKLVSDSVTYFFHSSLPSACLLQVELFSWKTTSHKDHLEVCLPNSRVLSKPQAHVLSCTALCQPMR